MSRNELLLRQAIEGLLPVFAVYQDRKRWLCPHVLGRKGPKLHLLAYQYAGESSSGLIVPPVVPSDGPTDYWRCMDVSLIEDLSVLEPGPWYTCRRHTQRQTCVDRVMAEVRLVP